MSRGTGRPLMKLALDCIPCFVRHTLEVARFATPDPAMHEQILREMLAEASRWDMRKPAPELSQLVHRRLRALTGMADPYKRAKQRFNELAMEMLPELEAMVETAENPLGLAVRLAIAGNVIDLGVNGGLSESDVRQSLSRSLSDAFTDDFSHFRETVFKARKILYLADNTGEIVFDRLLIARLPAGRVTVAVRGAPVLNDATAADARFAGLDRLAEIIDNGSDAPGTILRDCGSSFRKHFESADVIIAKGQGNFETLSGASEKIFFLLKIKCPVVAAHTGLAIGTQALINSHRWTIESN